MDVPLAGNGKRPDTYTWAALVTGEPVGIANGVELEGSRGMTTTMIAPLGVMG